MAAGPFGSVLRKLAAVRKACRTARADRVRMALVTARTAPAHVRVVNTLRARGIEFDEAHFVGDGDKGWMLAAFGAHIFDDQERHVLSASRRVAAALVRCRADRRPASRDELSVLRGVLHASTGKGPLNPTFVEAWAACRLLQRVA